MSDEAYGKTIRDIDRLEGDIKILWSNSKDLDAKITASIDKAEEKIVSNDINLQLLSKDVNTAISAITEFMGAFKEHDTKEMEKYVSIEKSINDSKSAAIQSNTEINACLVALSASSEAQAVSISALEEVADKAKKFFIGISLIGTIIFTIATVGPGVYDVYQNISVTNKSEYIDKDEYYDKVVAKALERAGVKIDGK